MARQSYCCYCNTKKRDTSTNTWAVACSNCKHIGYWWSLDSFDLDILEILHDGSMPVKDLHPGGGSEDFSNKIEDLESRCLIEYDLLTGEVSITKFGILCYKAETREN